MLTSRQQLILKAIVEEFIENAEPIGSKTLVEKYGLDLSSATIRNEMYILEQEGLIEKTHTSSGRVPSIKGYKYYAEKLMDKNIEEEEKNQIQSSFALNLPIDEIIQQSCDVLSHMTNLTSVVLGPDANQQTLQHIKLFPVDENSAVAVFITNEGHTENKTFHFSEKISVDDITKCTEILNDRLVGTTISNVVEKLNEIKPLLIASVKKHEELFNAFMQAFVKFAQDNVYYSGLSNMLYQPEFSDIEKLKDVMKTIENSSMWRQLSSNETSNKLVSDNEKEEMIWVDDMAVVSSKFNMGDQQGKLMVVGPSRMNYNKIMSILNFTAEYIEKQYKDKNKK